MARESPHRVLVIDDEQVVLDASVRLLSADGFDVIGALDAETGLEIVAAEAPDLAVVDLKLPGMSGLDFLDAAASRNPKLLVILTTGVSGADQAVAALNHGAFDFLPKPFTYEELMSPVLRASRWLALAEEEGQLPCLPQDPDSLYLGLQAWARPERGQSIRLGVSHLFGRTVGEVVEIIPCNVDAEIRQGGSLARIRTADARWHVALAAVGGRVIEANAELLGSPRLLNDDPTGEGWIAVVHASELHRYLPNLSGKDR